VVGVGGRREDAGEVASGQGRVRGGGGQGGGR